MSRRASTQSTTDLCDRCKQYFVNALCGTDTFLWRAAVEVSGSNILHSTADCARCSAGGGVIGPLASPWTGLTMEPLCGTRSRCHVQVAVLLTSATLLGRSLWASGPSRSSCLMIRRWRTSGATLTRSGRAWLGRDWTRPRIVQIPILPWSLELERFSKSSSTLWVAQRDAENYINQCELPAWLHDCFSIDITLSSLVCRSLFCAVHSSPILRT